MSFPTILGGHHGQPVPTEPRVWSELLLLFPQSTTALSLQ